MGWVWHWLSSHGPWTWLSPLSLLSALLSWWQGRRRGWRPRAWARRNWGLAKALNSCLGDVEDRDRTIDQMARDLTNCEQSMDGGRRAIDYATHAIREMANAAEQIKAAKAEAEREARSTNSTGSRIGRSPSRKTSTGSPRTRKRGPLNLP